MNFLSMCFYGFFLTRFSIRFVCSCELPFLCVFVSCFAVHIEITTICCVKTKQKRERERERQNTLASYQLQLDCFFFSLFALNELVVKIGSEVVGAGLYSRTGIKIREVLSPLASRLRFFITTARVDCQCIMWARTCCVLMQLMLLCC